MLDKICQELKQSIERAYAEGVTMQEAERLAAKTLSVRMMLADSIQVADLDARMRRHGVKAVRASAYMEELSKHEKKPAEGFLENAVNLNPDVAQEEREYATVDTEKDRFFTYLGIMADAHIFFRNVAKGSYE